jgi:hypothetical protein
MALSSSASRGVLKRCLRNTGVEGAVTSHARIRKLRLLCMEPVHERNGRRWESSFHVTICSGLQFERFPRPSIKNRFVGHAHFPQLCDGALVQVEKSMPTSRPALLVS